MGDYTEHLISMAGGDGDHMDLDAIQARADAATEGPWEHQPYGGQNQNGDYAGGHIFDADGEYVISEIADKDGSFIANARTDVPALLALVREQQAQIERAAVIVSEYMADYSGGIEIHYADLARLRTALTATVQP